MGALLGKKDHLAGTSSGDIPGNSGEPSRIGQNLGMPKQRGIPLSVDGPRTRGIRHAMPLPPTEKLAGASDKLPKIPKGIKLPKL